MDETDILILLFLHLWVFSSSSSRSDSSSSCWLSSLWISSDGWSPFSSGHSPSTISGSWRTVAETAISDSISWYSYRYCLLWSSLGLCGSISWEEKQVYPTKNLDEKTQKDNIDHDCCTCRSEKPEWSKSRIHDPRKSEHDYHYTKLSWTTRIRHTIIVEIYRQKYYCDDKQNTRYPKSP